MKNGNATSAAPQTLEGLLGHEYLPIAGFYDEMVDVAGSLRPHWSHFFKLVNRLGPETFSRRWRQSQRIVHQNGIAFGSYDDAQQVRPWELDPFPVLIPESEWRAVSEALKQRAELLNQILVDLYGPQNLLKQGLIPAEVVFRHPGFLRPFHNQPAPNQVLLHFYAADLARAPDGQWWILGDRTESPSGSGYALENRMVMSRMLPRAFRECRVERLAPYFIAVRDALRRLASGRGDDSRVALLSQGPNNANYFEDAFLARYLSYTLAEGNDLAFRNNKIMLKTLAGLQPVDVIWRRPNSEDCDPLELAAKSSMGPAGLLQAVRSGGASMANALGTGLVESPVLMAFLPKLCRALFGEDLKTPGVATWWCGDQASRHHVLQNLERLIVRPAFRRRGMELESMKRLVALGQDQLAEEIQKRPAEFVAQERVARSTTPVWEAGSIRPSHIAFRAFAVRQTEDYMVMNGALARVSDSTEPLFISLLSGESSKDAWIVSESPVPPVTLLAQQGQPVELRRLGTELPSRVAEHIFWLGRNLERIDAMARTMRTVVSRVTSETYNAGQIELPALLRVLVEQGQLEPGYVVEGVNQPLPDIEKALPLAAFDESQLISLRSTILSLYRTASVVRDRISMDSWSTIHRIYERFRPPARGSCELSDLLEMLDECLIDLAAFSGFVTETMPKAYTWLFLDAGRRIERALQTINLLKQALGDRANLQAPILEAVLEISASLMTYKNRYFANIQFAQLFDLLVTDATYPRSVAFQLESVMTHVNNLPRDRSEPLHTHEQRLAMSALHSIRMIDVQAIADAHDLGDEHGGIDRLLGNVEEKLSALSEAITHKYLIHSGPAHQLAQIRPD